MKELESGDRLAAEAKERAEKATPGPWLLKMGPNGWWSIEIDGPQSSILAHRPPWDHRAEESLANGKLMHSAHADIPTLVAEVERRGAAIRHMLECGPCWDQPPGCGLDFVGCDQVAAILAGEEKK